MAGMWRTCGVSRMPPPTMDNEVQFGRAMRAPTHSAKGSRPKVKHSFIIHTKVVVICHACGISLAFDLIRRYAPPSPKRQALLDVGKAYGFSEAASNALRLEGFTRGVEDIASLWLAYSETRFRIGKTFGFPPVSPCPVCGNGQ